jgi:hypothetical protein
MRFYTKVHEAYCGIALHARTMYVCIFNRDCPDEGCRAGVSPAHRQASTRQHRSTAAPPNAHDVDASRLRGFFPCRRRECEAGTSDSGEWSRDEGQPPARKSCRQGLLTDRVAITPFGRSRSLNPRQRR